MGASLGVGGAGTGRQHRTPSEPSLLRPVQERTESQRALLTGSDDQGADVVSSPRIGPNREPEREPGREPKGKPGLDLQAEKQPACVSPYVSPAASPTASPLVNPYRPSARITSCGPTAEGELSLSPN